jgi:isopenicillin N synthase-like dioxygenase
MATACFACSIIRRRKRTAPISGPGAHEDINTITLLLGAEEAGLQLLDRDGNWLPVQPRPGELAINVGDMLQRLTNNRLRSTTHRVLNPAPERRGHCALFDALLPALPAGLSDRDAAGCIDADHPNLYPEPITAHDYLYERLREIRLI